MFKKRQETVSAFEGIYLEAKFHGEVNHFYCRSASTLKENAISLYSVTTKKQKCIYFVTQQLKSLFTFFST